MSRSSFHKPIFRAAHATGLAAIFAIAASATAQAASKVGWLWADQPNATSQYTPNVNYSYNSSGGSISVTPISTGYYQVNFGKLYSGSPSNVQISAFDTSGYCTSSSWGTEGAGQSAEMWISCFNAAGTPTNSYFTLLYQARTAPFGDAAKGIAYFWADQPTNSSYTPDLEFNYNSTGTPSTIVRTGTGVYEVTVPGLSKQGGNVQVTAYNGDKVKTNPSRCKSDGWNSNGSANIAIVECFDSTGAPADEKFNFAFTLNEPFGLTSAAHSKGAYAWTDKPQNKHVYTPDKTWNYSGFGGGKVTSQKLGTGSYQVSVPGSGGYDSSLALVTGYDDSTAGAYCNVVGWYPIDVQCYKQGGVATDSEFNVAFQTAE
jgi:hypothetical protein